MDEQTKENVKATKQLRIEVSELIAKVELLPKNRSSSLAITKLDEAKMWLGRSLGELGQELPAEYADNPA